MGDGLARTPRYAEGQVKVLLGDLRNSSHNVKAKAIKHFQAYIEKYQPDIYDDDVDFLFMGTYDGTCGLGLLHWSGLASGNHSGQLKRICGPAIGLITFLLTTQFEGDNIFYERFILLPVQGLKLINFVKHILSLDNITKGLTLSESRDGSPEDAMKILTILLQDHRTPDGDNDPIDLNEMLDNNSVCIDKFKQWCHKSAVDQVTKTITAQIKTSKSNPTYREIRPLKWDDLESSFRPVPLQDCEEVENNDIVVEEDKAVTDPLGLSELDLRLTQDMYSAGKFDKLYDGGAGHGVNGFRAMQLIQLQESSKFNRNKAVDIGDYDDYDDHNHTGEDEQKANSSILPTDKNFSGSLFLSLIHGNTSFDQMKVGLEALSSQLLHHTSERENLIRTHFGLFIHCLEGLEWLKDYRLGLQKVSTNKANVKADTGETRLLRAQISLDKAKVEAQRTLAPILDRMKKAKQIKSADQVLRRLATTLEYPNKMKQSLADGDYEEVISIYQRVSSIPAGTSLQRILKKVRETADDIANQVKKMCIERMLREEPNFDTLLRFTKILESMEGKKSYLAYLHQCFAKQLQYFSKEMTILHTKYVDKLLYLNVNATELSSLKSKQSTLYRSYIEEGINYVLTDSRGQGEPIDRNSIVSFAGGNRSSVVHRDNNPQYSFDASSDEERDELTEQVFHEEENDDVSKLIDYNMNTHQLLFSFLRMKQLKDVIDVMFKWFHCLNRLCNLITSETDQQGAGASSAVAGKKGLNDKLKSSATASSSASQGAKKDGNKSTRQFSATMIKCSEIVNQLIFGYKAAPVVLSDADHKAVVDDGTAVELFVHNEFLRKELPEVYYVKAVQEVSEWYTLLELMLSNSRSKRGVHSLELTKDNIYYDSLEIFRSLSQEGEISMTKRTLSKLLRFTSSILNPKSSAGSNSYYPGSGGEREVSVVVQNLQTHGNTMGSSLLTSLTKAVVSETVVHRNLLHNSSQYVPASLELAVTRFTEILSKAIPIVHSKAKRGNWVATTVFNQIKVIVNSFVSSLKVQLTIRLSTEDPLLSSNNKRYTQKKKKVVPSKDVSELEEMNTLLKNGYAKTCVSELIYLDLVRALVALRTVSVASLWSKTLQLFPNALQDEAFSDLKKAKQLVVPGGDENRADEAFHIYGSVEQQSLLTILTEYYSNKDNYQKVCDCGSNLLYEKGILENLLEVVTLEDFTVKSYINSRQASLRNLILSGYHTIVAKENSGRWVSLASSSLTSNCFPAHLAKAMIFLIDEKHRLEHVLGGLTLTRVDAVVRHVDDVDKAIESQQVEVPQRNRAYVDYLYGQIASSLLDVYSNLVSMLQTNTFPGVVTASNLVHNKLAYGQALEELEYVKFVVKPLLNTGKARNPKKDEGAKVVSAEGSGVLFPSLQQLKNDGKILTTSI
jgi:hypothetical protein